MKQKLTVNLKSRTPDWYDNISKAVRFIILSLILTFSTTDLYTPEQSKHIVFWLGVSSIVIQGLDIALGTKVVKEESEVNMPDKP